MKTVIIPEVCKGEDAKYSGQLEMRPPFIEERWSYLEECGLLPQGDEIEAKAQTSVDMTRTIVRVLMPKLQNHVTKVDIVCKETGEKLDSLDALRCDPDAAGILMECASLLIKGFKPGKP